MKLEELKEAKEEDRLYFVRVRGNFYGGKYYEDGLDSILVLASSEEEAVANAKKHVDAVEKHFRSKKIYGGKLAIAKKDKKRFKADDIKGAKVTSTGSHNKVLQRDGTVGPVTV